MIFGLENGGKSLFFMSRHFDQTMTILILRFVIRINKMTIFKTKHGIYFIYFSIFATLFQQHVFPIYLYKVTYKWRTGEITYHQVNGSSNETKINFN